jgi:16S rRNA G966 N2-methylase RsmD
MLVTTSYKPTAAAIDRAKRLADELNARYVERGTWSVRKLGLRYRDPNVLLVAEHELQYYGGGEKPLFFHPSLSLIRVKRLMNGQRDALIDIAEAAPGDRVLDCTAGLGADAIVFSYAVGGTGQVTAVESESALYTIVREGLAVYETQLQLFDEAMRRVRLTLGHHLDVLKRLADNSVDIVYFDPMFRQPVEESSAIGPLRQVANHDPLTTEAVAEAVRVARKTVVLKEHRDSGEFERLGFERPARTRTKIAYGVIRP